MRSRKSFFKPIALKKDILRFAPIWALYLIGMLLLLMEGSGYHAYDRFAYYLLPDLIPAFGIVNLCYASLCAVSLFGDLYNTKLCYSLHAMPYRRESWLGTHLLAGLLFSLVPNAIAALYLVWRLEAYWFLGLMWLLAATLQYLFFFGIATVSTMLTGNRFAALLVCAGFNFVSLLLYATITMLYLPILYGVVVNVDGFSLFSPVRQLFKYDFFRFTREDRPVVSGYDDYYNHFFRYDGLGDGWGYLAIIAAVGLAAMALSVWLYRKRHLESAGDFIAFPKLKGLSCVIMTLCVTLCFALVGELFGNAVVWMIVGLAIGFFGSLMLLERRVKVFRKKAFLGFVAMVLVMALSLCAVFFDLFGIESWVPKADRVASVTVTNMRVRSGYAPFPQDLFYGSGLETTLTDPADIARIVEAHADILSHAEDERSDRHRVTLVYKMKSGRTVVRSYMAVANGLNYEIIRGYLYQADSVLGFTDPSVAAKQVEYMTWGAGHVPQSMYEAVLKALQADCKAGYITPEQKYEHFLEYLLIDEEGKENYRYVAIMPEAKNVLALLNSPEVIMGYSDWTDFLSRVQDMTVDANGYGTEIAKSQHEGLLSAMRKDVAAGVLRANDYYSGAYLIYYKYRTDGGYYEYREFYISEKAENTILWLKENIFGAEGWNPQG